jgi:2-polyprenyl-3-methyl-5-hydroxy-6-metoxy-1,4-benzoquinol methylase
VRKRTERNIQELHHDWMAISSDKGHFSVNPDVNQFRLNEGVLHEIRRRFSDRRLNILEVGAGRGLYTLLFLAEGWNVVANDISKQSLLLLKQKADELKLEDNLTLDYGNIEAFSTRHKDKSLKYDLIFLADTFHHLEFIQTSEVLKMLRHYVDEDGYLISLEPNGLYPFWRFMHLINREFKWKIERNILHCTYFHFKKKFFVSNWKLEQYGYVRFLPIPLITRFSFFEKLDRLFVKTPLIRSFSAYSLIIARPK